MKAELLREGDKFALIMDIEQAAYVLHLLGKEKFTPGWNRDPAPSGPDPCNSQAVYHVLSREVDVVRLRNQRRAETGYESTGGGA